MDNKYLIHYVSFSSALVVSSSLMQPEYSVDEHNGTVSICAVLNANVERIVELLLTPITGTAAGM